MADISRAVDAEVARRLQLAISAGKEAGCLTLQYFQQDNYQVERKGDASPVTIADRSAELLLRERITAAFPRDGIVGEEYGTIEGSSGFNWILDPIDGTKSFISGVPMYGTLVGVESDQLALLPLVGRVAAGAPVMSDANYEDYRRVDPRLFRPRADYLLKVRGDSMRDAGILDGDLLAVHSTPTARPGQIVVARIEDEITVKRFEQRGNIVLLKAENPAYEPIRVDLREQELAIEGVYAGLLRPGQGGA